MTRTPESEAAQRLQAAGAEIVQADFLDRPSLTRALEGAYGAFSVQAVQPLGTAVETIQGYAFADAAKAAGVRHLLYSSICGADRGTGIGHFESKATIEDHIRRIGVPATILRPVFLIENLAAPGALGTVWWGAVAWVLRGGRKLQVLAGDDVGAWAALCFADPQRFIGQAIDLAGDELTLAELREIYGRVAGRRAPVLPIPASLLGVFDRDMSAMFKWLRTAGFTADASALRQVLPSLKRFEEGLRGILAAR